MSRSNSLLQSRSLPPTATTWDLCEPVPLFAQRPAWLLLELRIDRARRDVRCPACQRRCLFNARPRKFDVSDKLIMGNMADLMVRELWGAYEHEHKQRVMQLTRVVGCFSEPLLFVEASQTQPWVILHLNEAAVTVTGQISGLPKVSLKESQSARGASGLHHASAVCQDLAGTSFDHLRTLVRQLSVAQALVLLYLVCGLNPWVNHTGAADTPACVRMLERGYLH